MQSIEKRLKILADDEIEAIYGQPQLTHEERIQYFTLSSMEKAALEDLHSFKSRICFILQLGYFKARHLFFALDFQKMQVDAEYIQKRYFPEFLLADLKITKVTRLKHRQLILNICHYICCDKQERRQLTVKARQAAKVCGKPIYIFRELMNYLEEKRIVAPGHSSMQDTVSKALTYEQDRLITIIRLHLKPEDIEALKRLLIDTQGLYEITQLKREAKDFSIKEIKHEIHRGDSLRHLYQLAQVLLPKLNISNESLKYYASLVTYYSVHRLQQLNEWVVYIYFLCFAYHRYQRLHDNLINCLIYNVRRYIDLSKSAAKDMVYEHHTENNQNLQKAGQVLKLFTDSDIAGNTLFQDVQTKAFSILEPQILAFVADHIATNASFDETAFQWDHVDELAGQFKLHLRPILHAAEFAATSAHAPLFKAVNFLKEAFRRGRPLGYYRTSKFPVLFIPTAIQRYLYTQKGLGEKCILPNRYEFLVYRLLRQGLEAGDIFCRDSVRFRSLEDDLLDDQQWGKKEELIAETGLTILNQPIEVHLIELEQMLEARIAKVNQRINTGENEHLQIKRHGSHVRWTLPYQRNSESVNHPFFDALKQVDVGSILHFVDQKCGFMHDFDHVLGRYAKQEADDCAIVACLVAWATNMGLGRMGEVSDIGYHQLAVTSSNFIRLETLKKANDQISNAVAGLPIFRHYHIGDALHSSSDGQKFETRIDTINARHSPKYFGLKKGVVSYTLVANHIPINARVIGANEHESHYVFDILFNNTTDIQPDMHSTDTHGANEVNFAILHLFGYQFAPRYKDIYNKVKTGLYGFKHPSQYNDWIIKPIRKINVKLIIEEWENIQRIITSLALKTTTQSIIVGKLSAHARKNKTKRALWEYDNIIRSLYLLDYIDSLPMRQNVHRALNRGENYHQLRRAVSHANFGKLRFKTEYDQQLWGECSRLITNCIIYYNATILSSLLAHQEKNDNSQFIAMLKQVSPVAWQHINLQGRYRFNKRSEPIDINAIINNLLRPPIQDNAGSYS